MFSGLVTNIGEVVSFKNNILAIKSPLSPAIGASVAVNGACLTITNLKNHIFEAFISKETQDSIALENLTHKVHLEEALKLGDRFDGHIVQGHIDGIGIIESIERKSNGVDIFITFDKDMKTLIVPKGSICIDGVSLTINDVFETRFRITIIPHTFSNTLFHTYKPKRRVNIESDIIVRSLYHILKGNKNTLQWRDIDDILLQY